MGGPSTTTTKDEKQDTTGSTSGYNYGTQSMSAPDWAQGNLADIASQAKNVYTSSVPSSHTNYALRGMNNYAKDNVGMMNGANNFTGGVLSGQGSTPGSSTAMNAMQQMAAGDSPYAAYARGDYVNGGSPQFNAALDNQSEKIGNQVNQIASASGRYGSGSHAGVLTDRIGDFRDRALQGEMARQQGMQLQAGGMMDQSRMQGAQGLLGNMFQAANMAPGQYQAGLMPWQTMAGVASQKESRPWDMLNRYQEIMRGLNPSAYGTRTTEMNSMGENQSTGTSTGTSTAKKNVSPWDLAMGASMFLPWRK